MTLERVAQALGPAFRLDGSRVVHVPTGTTLVAIPGGTFTMGFTLDDIRAVWCAVPASTLRNEGEASGLRGEFARARPPRRVTVEPFLVATDQADGIARSAADARRFARKHGFRLPTEAEWEWIAREGGAARFTGISVKQHPVLAKNTKKLRMEQPNGFGVNELQHEAEWVGDDRVTRFGHIGWQDDVEICALHAAYRSEGSTEGYVRFALDWPAAVTRPRSPVAKGKGGVDLASMRETLDGLGAADALPSVRTIESALLDDAPGDDLLAVVAMLPKLLPKMKSAPAKEVLLRALGMAATKNAKLKRALAAGGESLLSACRATADVVIAKKAARKAKEKRERTTAPFPWLSSKAWEKFAGGFYYPKDARAKSYQLLIERPELLGDLDADAREARVLEVVALRVAAALARRDFDVTAEGNSVEIAKKLMPKCPTAKVARAVLTVAAGGMSGGAEAVKALAKHGRIPEVKAELARFAKLRIDRHGSYPARVRAVHG